MFSRYSIYALPHDWTLSANINGNHDHVCWYTSYYQSESFFGQMPSPHIPGLAVVVNKNFLSPTAK